MNRRAWFIVALTFIFALIAAAGCAALRNEGQQPPPADRQAVLDISELTEQWVGSGHSNIRLLPAQRDGCVACHDGGAFAEQFTQIAQIERDYSVATDCRACHTGRGVELMEAGTADIPTAENVRGGMGALCMSCHNERRMPDIEERGAPHNSAQAGVFTATGGIRAEGFNYGSTQAHVDITDSCVGCHMTQTEGENGFASHTFRVEKARAACGECHQNIADINPAARQDYDGDGATEGFQDEVTGLLTILSAAIAQELNGGSFASVGGVVQFKSGEDVLIDQVPNEVYQAAYNYLLVEKDGSLGVHNPRFAVQLLQQSYRVLTGEDVPDAAIKE